jgi:alkylated DNA nucleotide flippase Atl1
VPCHRVVASDGRLNGFNGSRGRTQLGRKTKLLAAEGVHVTSGVITDFDSVLFTF